VKLIAMARWGIGHGERAWAYSFGEQPWAEIRLARVEHLSSTGFNDSIDRPPADAVRLFWRFVLEKYGITAPNRRGADT
jgi:hypothetical protein